MKMISTKPISQNNIENFYGRKSEIEIATDMLKNGSVCAVTGNLGIGKSSFLNFLKNELGKKYKIISFFLPSTDITYFYRKLLTKLIELYQNEIDNKILEQLQFTNEIETLTRLLLKGTNIGEIQEGKVYSFINSIVNSNLKQRKKVLSNHSIKKYLNKFLEKINEQIIVIIDDIDKIDNKNSLYNFFVEIIDLLNLPNLSFIFTLDNQTIDEIEKEAINEDKMDKLFSIFEEIINLGKFNINDLKEILTKEVKTPGKYFLNSSLRLLFSISRGNPRILNYFSSKILRKAKFKNKLPADINLIMDIFRNKLELDNKSLNLIKFAAENKHIDANSKKLQKEIGLDSVSIMMRIKELIRMNFLIPFYVGEKKVYTLNYVKDSDIL